MFAYTCTSRPPYKGKIALVLAHTCTDPQHVHGVHTQHIRATSYPHKHSSVRNCKTEESLKRLSLPCCCPRYNSGAKQLACGFSIVLLGSSSAESDPVVTCQFWRLLTPRARATEPGRDPHLHRGVQAGPRVPRIREREKKTAAGRGMFCIPEKKIFYKY